MPASASLAVTANSCGPDGFVVSATPGDGQVSLSWCGPAGNPDDPYYGYEVYYGTSSGGESTLANSSPLGIAVTSYDVPHLANGTRYYFVVKAVNSLGSRTSAEASATPAGSTSVPGAPTDLRATAGRSQVMLSWTAPTSNGGSAVTRYEVYQGTSRGHESKTPVARTAGPAKRSPAWPAAPCITSW
jgi:hypothetical protein